MEPLPHRYQIHLDAGASGYARISADGCPDLRAIQPRQFGGPGDAWSPEHLLLAAVQTCFLFTLRAVARAARVELVAVRADVTGTVDRQDGVTRFTEIILRPIVTVEDGVAPERVLEMVETSERRCLISASLSTPVHLDTRVEHAVSAA
ncbi:MAG TPA: OsmC family protein [Vicinamibacterales bacterium]|nr:OsmC family protein [Vicinamibacterales bacterium]